MYATGVLQQGGTGSTDSQAGVGPGVGQRLHRVNTLIRRSTMSSGAAHGLGWAGWQRERPVEGTGAGASRASQGDLQKVPESTPSAP